MWITNFAIDSHATLLYVIGGIVQTNGNNGNMMFHTFIAIKIFRLPQFEKLILFFSSSIRLSRSFAGSFSYTQYGHTEQLWNHVIVLSFRAWILISDYRRQQRTNERTNESHSRFEYQISCHREWNEWNVNVVRNISLVAISTAVRWATLWIKFSKIVMYTMSIDIVTYSHRCDDPVALLCSQVTAQHMRDVVRDSGMWERCALAAATAAAPHKFDRGRMWIVWIWEMIIPCEITVNYWS